MMALQGLRNGYAAPERAPVAPEDCAAAAERLHTLDRGIEAAAQRQYAELALHALQCHATFSYTAKDSENGSDR